MSDKKQSQKSIIQPRWYQMTRHEVLSRLKSKPVGLTSNEAKRRLEKYGPNELPKEAPLPVFTIILNQLKSPLVYVLIIAAGMSLVIGELFDVVVIMLAVLINTVVGYWQEYKADRTISKLKELVEHNVTVMREGRERQIPAADLVAGDIMLLAAGAKVPADGRILEANNLQVNEASLTGESFPVDKNTEAIEEERSVGDRVNMVFLGTTIARGTVKVIVTGTGLATEIGQIASLVKETEDEKTPLQEQLSKIGRLLTYVISFAAVGVFFIGLWRGLAIQELFVTAAALAVAAIPEGLLVAFTLVLVFGMQRILKKKALIRKLVAAETLGSVSVVCSDKTGTITLGQMKVDKIIAGGIEHDSQPEKGGDKKLEEHHVMALKVMALCNNAFIKNPQAKLKEWEIVGDSTDAALLSAAAQAGFDKEELNREMGRIDEIPFNESYKYQATMHHLAEDGRMVLVKGAPETVLSMSSKSLIRGKELKIDKKRHSEIEQEYRDLTKQGLRVLAIAYERYPKTVDSFDKLVEDREKPRLKDLVFMGWIGLKDPVREEAPESFQVMKGAGIRTVVITGDHKFTVKAIVEELGMKVSEDRILEGVDLEKMSDEELEGRIRNVDIFARVEPKHKLRIINAWRKQDEVVAMLGDGVNDAPALKAADIGVAVGSQATDVAKETSDMILLEGNFSVIEAAIREGRVIFDNIRKIFLYLISDSFTEIILISLALLTGYPIPLAAVHILWINIISDSFPNLALTMEPAEKDVMKFPPRRKDEPIVNREVKVLIATITTIAVAIVFALYWYYLNKTGDLEYTRTFIFTAFSIDSLIYVLSVKSLRRPIWKINLFNNHYLILAIIAAMLLQVAVVYAPFLQALFKTVPLAMSDWVLIFVVGIVEIFMIELVKHSYWTVREKKTV